MIAGRWIEVTATDDFYGTCWINADTGRVVEARHDNVWPATATGDDGTVWHLIDGGARGGAYQCAYGDAGTIEVGGIWRPAAIRPTRIVRYVTSNTVRAALP